MADPTTPADRAALITMTERDFHDGSPELQRSKLLAELDALRRALFQERVAVDRFRAAVRSRIEALRGAGHVAIAAEWRVMEIWLEQELGLRANVRKGQGS